MTNSAAIDKPSLESLVAETADEFMARLERGEEPQIEEYVARYPQHAVVIRQVLSSLRLIRLSATSPQAAREPSDSGEEPVACLGDFRILREVGRGGMGVVYEARQISLGRRVALKVLPFAAALDSKQLQRFKNEAQAAGQLHHQNIVPVYAVGSERGVHYYAMQFVEGQTLAAMIHELRRMAGLEDRQDAGSDGPGDPVAPGLVNELASGRWAPPAPARHGDQSEAGDLAVTSPYAPRTSPQGDRPPASPPGQSDTPPVAGLSTDSSAKSPAFFRTVANLGVQTAEALEHAHQMGVIHRDIKPANILVDQRGNPWITDFGLAQIHSDTRLTMTGDLLGTLRYMSPEQAYGKRIPVDHRTDIYSLGVTLYELLTLHPAYDGRDRKELLRQVAFEEPKAPRRRDRAIPSELETIVLKSIAKNPAERYATAQELADDLRRFLEDRPIKAKRPTLFQRVRKFARRHKPVVMAAAIAAVAVLFVTVGALAVSNLQINDAYRKLEGEKEKADAALINEIDARTRLAKTLADLKEEQRLNLLVLSNHRIALADRLWEANYVDQAEQVLDESPPELRGWEWRYLKRLFHPELSRHEFAISSRGNWLMSNLISYGRNAISPDGKRFAAAKVGPNLGLWDLATGREIPLEAGLSAPLVWVFSPDGRRLAVAGHWESYPTTIVDAVTGKTLTKLPLHDRQNTRRRGVCGLAFSPDGKQVLSIICTNVMICDADTGKEVRNFEIGPWDIRASALSADGRYLALANNNPQEPGQIHLWDVNTGKLAHVISGHSGLVLTLAFSPDGARLASGSVDKTVRLWDLGASGRQLLTLPGHAREVFAVTFQPDGKRLASGSADRSIKVWETTNGHELLMLRGHSAPILGMVYLNGGKQLATAGADGTVRVWDAERPHNPISLQAASRTYTLAFSHDSKRLAIDAVEHDMKANKMTRAKIYDLADPSNPARYVHFYDEVRRLIVTPEGQFWAQMPRMRNQTMVLTNIETGEDVLTIPPLATGWRFIGISPDGRRFAYWRVLTDAAQTVTGCELRILDLKTSREAVFPIDTRYFVKIAFSPDSRLVAAADDKRQVIVFDLTNEKILRSIPESHGSRITSLTFSADGALLASTSGLPSVGELKLWDLKTGKEVVHFRGHLRGIESLAISPDAKCIATGSDDTTVKIWDTITGKELLTLHGHSGTVKGVVFSPNGHLLASIDNAGNLKIWDGRPREEKASHSADR